MNSRLSDGEIMNNHMPKRPRQHQLEAESRASIRMVIPSRWVYRDLDQDYGIDSEVEIFDQSGQATGAKFLVQLKATDEPVLSKALRLRFPLSKFQYYASLKLPVLIARYHAPSKRFFVRWFHSYDPYYSNKVKAGVVFLLGEKDVWSDSTPASLAREVEAYREINSPQILSPISFSLLISGDVIHGIPAYQLRLHLAQAVRKVSHRVTFVADEDLPHSVQITDDKIEVKVAGSHGFSLHMPNGYAQGYANTSLHYDIMIGIGLALDWHGHTVEAAEIISPFLDQALIPRRLETAIPVARCLAKANQVLRAIEVAGWLLDDDSSGDAAQLFLSIFFVKHQRLSGSEQDFGIRIVSRIAKKVEGREDYIRAAALHYTIANLLRGMDRYREAIHDYREAARLNKTYLDRPYFWRELASVLFLSNRYALAAKLYNRSLILEEHRLTNLLYADALMFSGQYQDAETILEQNFESYDYPDDAEWALKRFALSWLREQTGIDSQKRKTPIFPESFQPRNLEEVEIEKICCRALKSDCLSALAWFNLGGMHQRAGRNENAAKSFLLAALLVPWDLEAWGNVIGLAILTRDTTLFEHALCVACKINGEEFLLHIADRLPKKQDEFMVMLAQAIDQNQDRNRGVTIRSHDPKGGWDEHDIAW